MKTMRKRLGQLLRSLEIDPTAGLISIRNLKCELPMVLRLRSQTQAASSRALVIVIIGKSIRKSCFHFCLP
jgi:hypothetical protein